MKTLYISGGANIWVDTENDTCGQMESQREAIQRIYLAEEPTHIVYSCGDYTRELDVKKDDIVLTFYTDEFENRIVVVKSKDWVNNLKKYNKHQQELKEKWAAENEAKKCEGCADACTNCKLC